MTSSATETRTDDACLLQPPFWHNRHLYYVQLPKFWENSVVVVVVVGIVVVVVVVVLALLLVLALRWQR